LQSSIMIRGNDVAIIIGGTKTIFNSVTQENEEEMTHHLLALRSYNYPEALEEVISIIVDKACEQPRLCEVYARLCAKQVDDELSNDNTSRFAKALVQRSKRSLVRTQEQREFGRIEREKKSDIDAEKDEQIKKDKQTELLKMQYKVAKTRFDDANYISHLFLHGLIPVAMILNYSMNLLASVTDNPEKSIGGYPADDISIERAVSMFETIGKSIDEENLRIEAATAAALTAQTPPKQIKMQFPLDRTFEVLGEATAIVGGKLSARIKRLIDLRANGWVPKEGVDYSNDDVDEARSKSADLDSNIAALALEKASLAIEKASLAIVKASMATENASLVAEKASIATISTEKAVLEKGDVRKAVADMQTAMEVMRKAMAALEVRSKALQESVNSD
ncbi:hypothetical protein PMAYCL1PPCAC_13714, partial [Pristionchus mayeri]